MYEMKYFRTLVVFLLLWKITLCNPNLTKFNLIKYRQIFYEGKIVSIKSLLEESAIHNSEDTSSKNPNVLYTSRKCMYADTIIDLLQTFFEIFVYGVNSFTEIHIPDIKDYTKNWLISAVNYFKNIKPPIVKMIDDLFFYSDKIKMLRTSDQSLLKSLLSINLFLYHSLNNNPFIVYTRIVTNDQNESIYIINDNDFIKTIKNFRVLNSSIIQMIGLVERFRSKNCVVQNPYKYNFVVNEKLNDILIRDVENIRNLVQPFFNRLNTLVNEGSDNYNNFNSKMYDPEYLLFEMLLDNNNSFLGNVQIHFNGRISDLKSIYNDTKKFCSIKEILEFQHILIKVIADVFYAQIYNLSNNSQYGIIDLTNLHSTFKDYTNKMLPSNCSINVCNQILKARAYLDKILDSCNFSTDSDGFLKLKSHFEPENNIELINYNAFQESADPSLSFLFLNMWGKTQHKSFRKVINLLSNESYINNDFYIVKVSDQVEITSQTIDPKFLKSMIELQYALFAFWTLLKMENNYQVSNDNIHYSIVDVSDLSTIGFTNPENHNVKNTNYLPEIKCRECEDYGPIFADMLRVIVNLFTSLDENPAVRNILLPLLIHFKQNDRYSHQLSEYDLSMMLQISFLTITIVENYLIKNYSFAFYSLFIYSKFVMNNNNNGPIIIKLRHDLQTYAETSTISFKNTLEFLSLLYDVSSCNTLFPEDYKKLKFFWNGNTQFGYDVFQNGIKGVIDYNDLIGLQWFGAKLVISKIVMKLMNALTLLRYFAFEQIFHIIKNKLNELLILEFPVPIKTFLDDLFKATLATLDIEWINLNHNTYHQWDILFYNSLIAIDAYPSNNEPLCSEIETIISDITFEIEKLKNLVQSNFLGTQNILVSTDLCLSPTSIKISDKIIEMSCKID